MRGVAIALVFPTLAACAASRPKWEPFRGKPPIEVVLPHEGLEGFGWQLTFEMGVRGLFHHEAWDRCVRVLWERGSDGGNAEYPTEYLPTTLLAPNRTSLLVAGKRDDGRTVIELWTFDASVVPPRPIRTIVYDESRKGRDMVALLVGVPGSDSTCLVQFWDSRDIYRLAFDRTPASLRLLASPTPRPGALTVPELTQWFDNVWSGDYVSRGFMYHLGTDTEGASSLILVDADRDGRLDRYETVDSEQWGPSGWGDGTAYRHEERR